MGKDKSKNIVERRENQRDWDRARQNKENRIFKIMKDNSTKRQDHFGGKKRQDHMGEKKREHDRNTEWIDNMNNELKGHEEGFEVAIEIDSLRATLKKL